MNDRLAPRIEVAANDIKLLVFLIDENVEDLDLATGLLAIRVRIGVAVMSTGRRSFITVTVTVTVAVAVAIGYRSRREAHERNDEQQTL